MDYFLKLVQHLFWTNCS